MKIIILLLLIIPFSIYAKERWELFRFNFYFENDIFSATDSQYSSGEKFNWIYKVENPDSRIYNLLFLNYEDIDIYTSFSMVNQIYTPADLEATRLLIYDRPYAGWTYLEGAIHKSSNSHLRSLYLQIGTVGPNSHAEEIQNTIHKLIGNDLAMGWDNQIKNEIGINLRYVHKWRLEPRIYHSLESAFIPYTEVDLGNISTQAIIGSAVRFGWNIPKDFGVSTLDMGGEVGIPINSEYKKMLLSKWSFSINLSLAGSAVLHDIRLDGNTFKESHHVEKEPFIFYAGYGFSLRYKKFTLEYLKNINTRKFTLERNTHGVGTVVISWMF